MAVVGRYSTAALRGACALEAGTPRAAPADGGPLSLCRAGLGAGCGRLALGFWSWPFSSWFGSLVRSLLALGFWFGHLVLVLV